MAVLNGNNIFFGEVIPIGSGFDYSLYNRLEYIKSNGTQGIITDYIPSYTDILKFQLKLFGGDSSSSDTDRRVFSCGESYKFCAFLKSYNGGQLDVYLGYSWTSKYDSRINIKNTNNWLTAVPECPLQIKRGNSYCGGASNYTDAPITLEPPDEPLSIFGYYSISNNVFYPFKQRVNNFFYGVTIFDSNGVSKCNLVPAERKSDAAIGLYDTVAQKFYTNAGTGTFEKGEF